MTLFVMGAAHTALTVRARSRVSIRPAARPDAAATPPWETARDHDLLPLEAIDCLFDSSSIQSSGELAGYARPSFPPERRCSKASSI